MLLALVDRHGIRPFKESVRRLPELGQNALHQLLIPVELPQQYSLTQLLCDDPTVVLREIEVHFLSVILLKEAPPNARLQIVVHQLDVLLVQVDQHLVRAQIFVRDPVVHIHLKAFLRDFRRPVRGRLEFQHLLAV